MPSIDINDVVPRGQVTAANGQTIFNYNYILFSQDDLVVIKDGVTLTLSDYTVTGVGNETGGTFVLNVACAGGEIVTHYRQSGLGRGSQYQVDGLLSANPLERDFDRIFTILQEQKRDIDRGVKLDPEDTVSQLILPVTTDRQGKFLAFDSSGNAIASAGTVGDSAIAVSSFMETLLGDPDAATARATLGAAGLASPTFTGTVTIPTLDLTNALSVVDGGTGQSSYTVGDLLYASGTTALSKLAAGTNGHVLTLSGGVPAWAALPSNSGLVVVRQVFTSSGTWNKNANLLYADVEVVGGGGGGGGTATATSTSAGGGGAGGYSRKVIAAATLGATETVTIGAGGTGGTAGGGAGGTGGTGGSSSFGTHCSATGGAGGVGANGAGNVLGGLGGAGASGNVNITGNAGGSSISATMSGFGGQGYLGGGARPVGTNIDGNAGVANTGAGGSGSIGSTVNGRVGGAGGSGIIIVTEYRSA